MLRGAANGAPPAPAVAARASSSSSARSLEGRRGSGTGSGSAPSQRRSAPGEAAPPRWVPSARLGRAQVPAVWGGPGGAGRGRAAVAAAQRYPGLINKRRCPPTSAPKAGPGPPAALGQHTGKRRPRLPAGLRHRAAAATAQSCPGLCGPRPARSGGGRRCGAGPARPGRQAAALGPRCCPEPGRGGKPRERCCRRSKCCLSAGGGDGREQEVAGRTEQPLGVISERDLPLPCPAQPQVRWQLWERWIWRSGMPGAGVI